MGFSAYEVRSLISDQETLDDSSIPFTYVSAGASDERNMALLSWVATSTDVASRNVAISYVLQDGTPVGFLTEVPVPAGAGHGIVPAVDLMAALPKSASGLVLCPRLVVLGIAVVVALTAAAQIDTIAIYGHF
jgi:hypothetical protein